MHQHIIFLTPFGNAALIYRSHPLSIIRSILPCPDLTDLNHNIDLGQTGTEAEIVSIAEMIIDYFNGKKITIPWNLLDFGNITQFQESVLKTTAAIPYGEVRTYQEIAEAVGNPKASRAVGTALAKNPFPLLIPCHRVIKSDGTIGKFGGGTEMKEKLIQLEQYWKRIKS